MRNKYKEQQKRMQRIAGKGQDKGIYLPHSYKHKKEGDLTWWDDMYFWINGIRYSVTFVHPRMKYQDICEQIAWDKLYPSYPRNEVSWKPYKISKRGKSRKQTTSFTMEDSNKEALDVWHQQLWEAEKELLKTSDVVVTPSVSVRSWNWSKNIDICVPYDVLSEEQAKFLTEMIREHYKAGTLFSWVDKMKAIKYSRNDWNREQNNG